MSKPNIPNAKAKAVGRAHKSGSTAIPSKSRRSKNQPPDAPTAPDLTGFVKPGATKTTPRRSEQKPQAAQGDDDLMSLPQAVPVITPAKP